MIRRAISAALLRRTPYLEMVIRRDGVADGAIVVVVVHALLMIPLLLEGLGVLPTARLILYGLVDWILLSGMVYLIGRHLLDGDGSFPGTMAATSIGFPVLLVGAIIARVTGGLIELGRYYSIVVPSFRFSLSGDLSSAYWLIVLWLVATVWMAARVALELPRGKAAAAAFGGWLASFIITLLLR